MAANIEIFGKDIQEWLGDTEPYEDDELDSVLIAASDEYSLRLLPQPARLRRRAPATPALRLQQRKRKYSARERRESHKKQGKIQNFARKCGKRGERREKKQQNRIHHH